MFNTFLMTSAIPKIPLDPNLSSEMVFAKLRKVEKQQFFLVQFVTILYNKIYFYFRDWIKEGVKENITYFYIALFKAMQKWVSSKVYTLTILYLHTRRINNH